MRGCDNNMIIKFANKWLDKIPYYYFWSKKNAEKLITDMNKKKMSTNLNSYVCLVTWNPKYNREQWTYFLESLNEIWMGTRIHVIKFSQKHHGIP